MVGTLVNRVGSFVTPFLALYLIDLGFSVATPLGGFLASRDYLLLFVLDAAASAGFAVLIVPETRPSAPGPLPTG